MKKNTWYVHSVWHDNLVTMEIWLEMEQQLFYSFIAVSLLFSLLTSISILFKTLALPLFASLPFAHNCSSTVLYIGFMSLFICRIHVSFGLLRLPFAFFKWCLKANFAGVISGNLNMCASKFNLCFFISVVMDVWCDLLYISLFHILSISLMFIILRSSFLWKISRLSSSFLVKVQISQL